MLSTLRSDLGVFLPYLGPSTPKLALLQLSMIARPLLGGFGFTLIVPLLAISGITQEEPTGNLGYLLDLLPTPSTLTQVLLVFFLIMLLIAVVNYIHTILAESVEQAFLHSLRSELYRTLVNAEWQHLSMTHQSDYTRIMTEEVEAISATVDEVIQLVSQLILVTIYTALCLFLSLPLTLLAIGLGLLLFAATMPIQWLSVSIGGRHLAASQSLYRKSGELIRGIKAIKSSVTEARQTSRFNEVSDRLVGEEKKFARLTAMSTFGHSVLSALAFCVLTYVALAFFGVETPTLILLALIFSRLVPQVSTLYVHLQRIGYMLPSVGEAATLVRLCRRYQETDGEDATFDVTRGIYFDEVSYLYPGVSRPVIDRMCVHLKYGELIAVTGTSGIGKSTFADMLTGINLPSSGRMLVGATPVVKENLKSWRQNVTYVPQDPFLIAGTVRENLLLLTDPAKNEEEIVDALQSAAANFVFELECGLDSRIGDDGITLSGGERQRLLIARALLSHRPVIVLDESTSQLDFETEDEILKVLARLRHHKIIVVISHRATIRDMADQVITINE